MNFIIMSRSSLENSHYHTMRHKKHYVLYGLNFEAKCQMRKALPGYFLRFYSPQGANDKIYFILAVWTPANRFFLGRSPNFSLAVQMQSL